jgi:5-methylthioadenosine/S-adenosylhomocysteine deaminase
MRLASGIMRVPEVQAAGIRIGLGLDGGTNDTADMFNNMRAAVGLQRAKSLDSHGTPTVAEVLRMATMGGAEVLDQEAKIGSLTPGKQADVIVIDPNALNFAPQLEQINQIVFNGQPDNVKWVFVAGRPLKARGKLVGVDERQLLLDSQIAVEDIAPAVQP